MQYKITRTGSGVEIEIIIRAVKKKSSHAVCRSELMRNRLQRLFSKKSLIVVCSTPFISLKT